MLPSETMIWQPEFTDKTLSRKPGAVHFFGSYKGGESAAIIYSLLVTCKLNEVEPEETDQTVQMRLT
ncbi:hypothetical protein IPA83_002128 [Escherichia coli]|nr:hypothetical protein [Escherichia coli]